jgi:hypothetical protein
MRLSLSPVTLLLGVGLVGAAWYVAKKGVTEAAAGAVGAVGNAAGGAVLGVGDVLGVPRTNETECERAIREGRTWDASFACPAGRFLSYLAGYPSSSSSSGGASGTW